MTSEELEKQTRTVVDCWNRSDWAGYRALIGPGYLYEEAGTRRRVEDVEVVMVGWLRLKTAFPDTAVEIVQVQVQGDVTIVEVIWRATQSGPLHGAAGVESSSYKKIQVRDLITMQWRRRQVMAERHQLGFLSLLAPLLDGTVVGIPDGGCPGTRGS